MLIENTKEKEKYFELIKQCFLFQYVDEETIIKILSDERLKYAVFEKNNCIYSYKSFEKSLGIILKGKISVNKYKENGEVLINYLKTGNAFGGAAVFSKAERYIAELRAETKCVILFVSDEVLKDMFRISEKTMLNYMTYLSDSLVFLNKRLDIFSAGNAEERIKEYIRINAAPNGEGIYELTIQSYSRLAEYLSIGRASLYRILDDFKAQGLIDKSGKKIYIKGELK